MPVETEERDETFASRFIATLFDRELRNDRSSYEQLEADVLDVSPLLHEELLELGLQHPHAHNTFAELRMIYAC